MTIKEYTKEFYKVNIIAGYVGQRSERILRYINGIRIYIHDEMIILSLSNVQELYHCALKVEQRLNRKQKLGRSKGQAYRGRQQKSVRNNPTTYKNEELGS